MDSPNIQDVLRDLPKTGEDRKQIPVTTGVLDYFPLALAEVAKISVVGNNQHNLGQPLHWARGKSVDHADCVARHLIQRGTVDSDGAKHTAKLAWRALALLQEEVEREAGFFPAAKSVESTPEPSAQEPVKPNPVKELLARVLGK